MTPGAPNSPQEFSPRELKRLLGHAFRPKPGVKLKRGGGGRGGGREWTVSEIQLLGKVVDEEAARLLRRSRYSVTSKREKLRIPSLRPRLWPWTKEELRLVRKLPDAEVARRTGRSEYAAACKRRELGLPKLDPNLRPLQWSKAHESLLGTMPDEQLAKKLGRSVAAVAARRSLNRISVHCSSVAAKIEAMSDREIARLLRIPHRSLLRRRPLNRRTRAPKWSESEERLLGQWPDDRLARFLGRTSKAVADRRQKLGLLLMPPGRPWTVEDERLLDTAPARGSIKKWAAELAARLGRTAVAVAGHRRELYGPQVNQRRWSQQELRLLGTRLDREVAAMVGRSCVNVQVKRGALGIPSYRARNKFKWTPAKDRLLGTQPDRAVAKRLGCSYNVAKERRQTLGVAAFVTRKNVQNSPHRRVVKRHRGMA